jgi:hypothetical protein
MTCALTDHAVLVDDLPLLTGLADAFSTEPDALGQGLFLVAQVDWSASRHRFTVGVIPSLARFTVCHRNEPYRMKPCAGSRLREVPAETQVLLALLTDDGWQSSARMPTGEQRLTAFAANHKFPGGLRDTVRMAKQQFGVQTFLVWHTIVGYWGGVAGPGLRTLDCLCSDPTREDTLLKLRTSLTMPLRARCG